jgi:hypothetical protein
MLLGCHLQGPRHQFPVFKSHQDANSDALEVDKRRGMDGWKPEDGVSLEFINKRQ